MRCFNRTRPPPSLRAGIRKPSRLPEHGSCRATLYRTAHRSSPATTSRTLVLGNSGSAATLGVSAAKKVKAKRAPAGSACATVGDMMARRATIALGILLAWCTCAFALDPALTLASTRTPRGRSAKAFPKGRVTSFAQTPDGYLGWAPNSACCASMASECAWDPPAGEHLPSSYIRKHDRRT